MKKNKRFPLFLLAAAVLMIIVFLSFKLSARNPRCPTDLNRDGITNDQDLLLFNASYNTECNTFFKKCPTDFNRDGLINSADLRILIGNMGKSCE